MPNTLISELRITPIKAALMPGHLAIVFARALAEVSAGPRRVPTATVC
jgi:hypothetical protein